MISIVVHGGAWDIPDRRVKAHRDGVQKALLTGWEILSKGSSADEAVVQAIMVMEEDPTFNAGLGSAMTALGQIELDAGIMNGKTHDAGAVACLQNYLHPIAVARKVMEESEHVFLAGVGAARFAREHGFKPAPADALIIPRELRHWKEMSIREIPSKKGKDKRNPGDTVGVVALDKKGLIVAGTSTGGTPHKHPGRIGDSPIIGSGLYADSDIGGVVSSGWGEGIMRVVLAKCVVDIMAQNEGDPQAAAKKGVAILKKTVKGQAGVIAMNSNGEVGVAFTTPRMAHAYMNSNMKKPVVAI